jgi:hypothetical protein
VKVFKGICYCLTTDSVIILLDRSLNNQKALEDKEFKDSGYQKKFQYSSSSVFMSNLERPRRRR